MYRTAPRRLKFHRALPAARLLIVGAMVFLFACAKTEKQYDYTIFAFGTLIEISIFGTDEQLAEIAFQQLQQDFVRFHQDWSPWTDGDLALINQQIEKKQPVRVPAHLVPIIKTSIALSRQSDNNYNPAIGRLINLWQFHKYQDSDIRPPDDQLIQQLLKQNPLMSDLTLDDNNMLNSSNPAVSLNFGAFAKGYAIELEIRKLRELGIHNAVMNAGGDLTVIGKHGERAWNIGIRHPRRPGLLASVEVKDNESVFTSGDYERFYYYQGKRYHHILNPKTGYPTDDTQSVTVIHPDAGRADAAATAIFVAGRKNWQQVAKDMGIQYVMLVDGDGNIHFTPAMKKRIKLLEKRQIAL